MSRMRLLRERAFVPRTALTGDPHEGPALRRCLTVWDLGFMGIGSMVGAGIFVVTGVAAANVTGGCQHWRVLQLLNPSLVIFGGVP